MTPRSLTCLEAGILSQNDNNQSWHTFGAKDQEFRFGCVKAEMPLELLGHSLCESSLEGWSQRLEGHWEPMNAYLQHEGRKRGENGAQVWIEEEVVQKDEVKNKQKCSKKIFF